jgi:hypothetical protein
VDLGGGTAHACSSPPPGCRTTADAIVGLMQAVLAPEQLSPSPLRTLRPVFVHGFSLSKLMVRVSTVRHHLQDAVPPLMLQSG